MKYMFLIILIIPLISLSQSKDDNMYGKFSASVFAPKDVDISFGGSAAIGDRFGLYAAVDFSNDPVITAQIVEDCKLNESPSRIAFKEVMKLYKGESVLILNLKTDGGYIVSNYWYYVLTLDNQSGYVPFNLIKLPQETIDLLLKTTNSMDRMSNTRKFFDDHRDSLRIVGLPVIERRKEEKEVEAKGIIDKMTKEKNELAKFKTVVNYSAQENILGYFDFAIQILNTNKKKVLKYAWFTVNGINPVGDAVGTKTVNAVGPLPPFEKGIYNFKTLIASKVIDHYRVTHVKIQFMDGSLLDVPEKEIKRQEFLDSYNIKEE